MREKHGTSAGFPWGRPRQRGWSVQQDTAQAGLLLTTLTLCAISRRNNAFATIKPQHDPPRVRVRPAPHVSTEPPQGRLYMRRHTHQHTFALGVDSFHQVRLFQNWQPGLGGAPDAEFNHDAHTEELGNQLRATDRTLAALHAKNEATIKVGLSADCPACWGFELTLVASPARSGIDAAIWMDEPDRTAEETRAALRGGVGAVDVASLLWHCRGSCLDRARRSLCTTCGRG